MVTLINWIKSWFTPNPKIDIYLPKQRNIYHYTTDGKNVISADPMEIETRLAKVRPQLSVDFKLKGSIHPDYYIGHINACQKIRDIFQIKKFSDGGLLDEEVLELLDHFFIYTDSIKKNSVQSQTSAPETSQSTAPSSAEQSPTPSSLPSGSSESEPKTEQPPSLPTEQPLPSECIPPTTNTTNPLPMEKEKQPC